MSENVPFQTILLLGESETALTTDKRTVKEAGFPQVVTLTSGTEACRKLAGLSGRAVKPSLIICAHRLADMEGEQFCAIIRKHPRLLALPVLLIMPNESEAAQLKALGCGASAILGRPYSIQELSSVIKRLLAGRAKFEVLRKGADLADTAEFDAALASYGLLLRPTRAPEDYFRAGMRLLEENRYNIAIDAFQRALESIKIKGEAELGIAAAYRGKGDSLRYQAWLNKAAETFVKAKRWHDARTTFSRLLSENINPRNPFLAEANRLMRENEYEAAAKTLAEGVPLIPSLKKAPLFANLCASAADSQAMYQALRDELANRDNGEVLTEEIRRSVEKIEEELKEKKRKESEERRSRLAREMRTARSAEVNRESAEPARPATVKMLSSGEEAASLVSRKESEIPEGVLETSLARDEAMRTGERLNEEKIAPLSEKDATSDLFANSPKINEFLSIIKYTCRMAKRKGK